MRNDPIDLKDEELDSFRDGELKQRKSEVKTGVQEESKRLIGDKDDVDASMEFDQFGNAMAQNQVINTTDGSMDGPTFQQQKKLLLQGHKSEKQRASSAKASADDLRNQSRGSSVR